MQQEERVFARLKIPGQISEDAYAQLRAVWSEKMINLQRKIEELEVDHLKIS